MNTYVLYVALFALSFFEVWLCYQLLFATIIDCKTLSVKAKISIACSIVVIGSIFSLNRRLVFFSHSVLIIGIAITCVWAGILFKRNILLLIELVTIFFSGVSLLDFVFAFIFMSFLGDRFGPLVFWNNISGWSILIFLCTRAFVGVVVILFLKKVTNDIHILKYRKLLFGACVFLCVILRIYQTVLFRMAYKGVPVKEWNMGISLLSILIIGFFCLLLVVKNKTIQNEKEILLVSDDMFEKRYKEMKLMLEENRRIVHDVRNHFLVLNSLCKNGDLFGAQRYLCDVEEDFQKETDQKWTGNEILDMFLAQKKAEAEKCNIAIKFQINPVVNIPLTDKDAVSLVGNLLDNAIEACQRLEIENRSIIVKIEQKYQIIFIEIVNNIDSVPEIKNGNIVTTKKDKNAHGYGLKNVSRIVEKYDGVMSIQAGNGKFLVSISFFI